MASRLDALLKQTAVPDWEVAVACRMHPSTLSRYRNGSRQIIQRHAVRLAEYFGVGVDDIRGEADRQWLKRVLGARAAS